MTEGDVGRIVAAAHDGTLVAVALLLRGMMLTPAEDVPSPRGTSTAPRTEPASRTG